MDLLNPQLSTKSSRQRLVDFFSSFGIMLVGVVLLIVCVLKFGTPTSKHRVLQFPRSGPRETLHEALAPKVLPISRPAIPLKNTNVDFAGDLSAKAALVVDNETNTVLFKKNISEPRAIASITKLMSALVLTDLQINWASSTTIVLSDLDDSSHQVKVGEHYTLEQLWNIGLINSANGAIKALSRASGLSLEQFVARMNAKAKELNLASARFVEPTGLDSKNMMSALDTARLLDAALSVDKIKNTLALGEYSLPAEGKTKPRRVFSTNWLLTDWIPNSFGTGAVVGKTGYIIDSGYNFAVRLTDQNKHSIRVIILGAISNEARFNEARDLGRYVFTNFSWPSDPGYAALREKALVISGKGAFTQ